MNKKCLACGSQNLDLGKFSERGLYYTGSAKSWLTIPVIRSRAYACLECGHVGIYVDPEKLKSKIKS